MTVNYKKEDLRILKTHKALIDAMSRLLKLRNFNQITVNDLCEEALISRATFYSHFQDKYDLLKYWLNNMKSKIVIKNNSYEEMENSINDLIHSNKKVIKNILEDANNETTELLSDFILSLLHVNIIKSENGQLNPKDIVFSRICGSGILDYLIWQVKNKFPSYMPVMNPFLYDILLNLKKWNQNNK